MTSTESNLYSPLTFSENVRKIESLDVQKIVEKYKKDFNLDVSAYFQGVSHIDIFECSDTNLKFYHPFGLAGDGKFYDDLSLNGKSYYSKSKWEFDEAAKYLKSEDQVLEIGCGAGYFLEQIAPITSKTTGLELNPRAIKLGQQRGVNILPDFIQDHAASYTESYDIVFAFQLFEHIEKIREMFESSLKVLKKGGKLIIGVPNNSSLIFKLNKYHTLNLPPHHMLLWDEESLAAVAQVFGLKLISIETQPGSRTLKSEIYKLKLYKLLGEGFLANSILVATRWLVKLLPSHGLNQSILAVYEKQ